MAPKDTFFSRKKLLNCRGKLIELSTPKVMGILNVTPDSFYDGNRYTETGQIKMRVAKMIEEGADFIDVGGFSSRPGAKDITTQEELKRVSRALILIRKIYPEIIISVDTFRSFVAKTVVEDFEVDMINDISAGNLDKDMFETIALLQVPYLIMHMQGTPQTMQNNPRYINLIPEILSFFSQKIYHLRKLGVNDIIVDPGFGFGKTLDQNYELLKRLDAFSIFELPVLVGLSRKSMIYKALATTPEDSLVGTAVVTTLALLKGANILRVHDVKETRECIKLINIYESIR